MRWDAMAKCYFNPLPSCEGRPGKKGVSLGERNFNPLPSCEGRQEAARQPASAQEFQSAPLTRGETCPGRVYRADEVEFQSTPLMRGETYWRTPASCAARISIHSPHARGDSFTAFQIFFHVLFQSTPLMRGETGVLQFRNTIRANFNPLPSCEGRHGCQGMHGRMVYYFNPLPSCEGRRFTAFQIFFHVPFQSTPLMRGETIIITLGFYSPEISIHSPHARGDPFMFIIHHILLISIHSPHARGDQNTFFKFYIINNFNPLPSCEGRLATSKFIAPEFPFQSTPLMRGETKTPFSNSTS